MDDKTVKYFFLIFNFTKKNMNSLKNIEYNYIFPFPIVQHPQLYLNLISELYFQVRKALKYSRNSRLYICIQKKKCNLSVLFP